LVFHYFIQKLLATMKTITVSQYNMPTYTSSQYVFVDISAFS